MSLFFYKCGGVYFSVWADGNCNCAIYGGVEDVWVCVWFNGLSLVLISAAAGYKCLGVQVLQKIRDCCSDEAMVRCYDDISLEVGVELGKFLLGKFFNVRANKYLSSGKFNQQDQ